MKTTTRSAKYPRRKRPLYPSLEQLPVGSQCLMERGECGANVEHPAAAKAAKRGQRILRGAFVFARPVRKPSRSNYTPHIGAKQIARNSPTT